ncbi:MAG: TnpV protein [Tyzzerella sp.]|nr:TnpV protein [Tyzzerella sp.]
MNITYSKSGNILLPNLRVPESPKEPLGIYGRMRRDYLKKNRHSIYSAMILKGTLLSHLAEIDKTCREEFELRIKAEAEKQGITEDLKAQDMLKWTGLMNNIQNSVREQIMHQFVYAEEGLQ